MKKMKVLILCPYPLGHAPSQRFRFEQYLNFLSKRQFFITQKSFLSEKTWQILYKPGNNFRKIGGIIWGFLKRFLLLFSMWGYDFVFIHREATPLGPPVIEWIVAKILRKKIVYDFDDAIWLANTSQENKLVASIKGHWKVRWICKWSYSVTCGNNYLAEYANQYNERVKVIPTTIDTKYHRNANKIPNSKPLLIGWTGTHSTEKYLDIILPVLQELEKKYCFTFRVISNHNPQLPLLSYEFKKWNKESEINDLSDFDIGVMPLKNDEWSKGKCGFKGLQYMALGIPTIMSSVGVNKEIITSGENGFLVEKMEDWKTTLSKLLEDSSLRFEIGQAGKKRVEGSYSVCANEELYLSLFS